MTATNTLSRLAARDRLSSEVRQFCKRVLREVPDPALERTRESRLRLAFGLSAQFAGEGVAKAPHLRKVLEDIREMLLGSIPLHVPAPFLQHPLELRSTLARLERLLCALEEASKDPQHS